MVEARETRGSGWFVGLFACMIILSLCKIGAFIAAGQTPLQLDALTYWVAGRRIVAGDWLLVLDHPEITRTPGYLYFVAFFQALCGTRALAAAIAANHLLLLASSLLACWACWRLTRSRSAVLLCMALSLACFSSHGVATNLLSDPLLSFLLTLCAALTVAWFQTPSVAKAVGIGAALGAAILVKPVAQLAWIPLAATMLLAAGRQLPMRRRVSHVACTLAAAGLVVAPWLIRNQVYFGSPFLTKFSGRSLWVTCFEGNPADRIASPIPFAEGTATPKVLDTIGNVDPRNPWAVFQSLVASGRSDIEADELMLAVAKEGIAAHPAKYAALSAARMVWFWITPNGTFRPLTGEYVPGGPPRELEHPLGWFVQDHAPDQVQWRSAWYFEKGWLNWLWFPHPFVYAIAAAITLAAIVILARVPEYHAVAIFFGLWFAYFTTITVLGAHPGYRYRMILEPVMIIVTVTAATHLGNWRRQMQTVRCDERLQLGN